MQMELLAWGKIFMEPHLFRIQPGKGSSDYYTHHGEEFLYIISGQLDIKLGEKKFQLSKGDSFYFESKTPHSWLNSGKVQTVVLWINSAAVV